MPPMATASTAGRAMSLYTYAWPFPLLVGASGRGKRGKLAAMDKKRPARASTLRAQANGANYSHQQMSDDDDDLDQV